MLQNGKGGESVMMRLTEKDDLGHWFLKGLEWGQQRKEEEYLLGERTYKPRAGMR